MDEKINKLHQMSTLNRSTLFDGYLDKFSNNLGEAENHPFLGYVGTNYFSSQLKICFVGKAGGESRFLTAADALMDKKFVEFKDSSIAERKKAFRDYQQVIQGHIQSWNVYRIPEYLNGLLGQGVHDIAYINIVPFRYKGAPIKSVYRVAWDTFTNRVFSVLNPHYIVPLGKRLHEEVFSNYNGNAEVTNGITRTNGDHYLHAEAIEQMNLLATQMISKRD